MNVLRWIFFVFAFFAILLWDLSCRCWGLFMREPKRFKGPDDGYDFV